MPGQNTHGQPLYDQSYNAGFGGLAPEAARALLANTDPNMSGGEDTARSVVTGLERGGAGILAAPGNISDLVGHGTEWALHHGYGALQDWTRSNLGVPYMGAGNKTFDQGPQINYAHLNGTVSQSDVDNAIQSVAGPYHAPQTTLARYAERGAEFAPMVLGGGGSLPGRVASTLASSVGSQALEDQAPEAWKPAAALAGAVLGGVPGAAWGAIKNAPYKLIRTGIGELTPQSLADAIQGQVTAANLPGGGIHVTPPEVMNTPGMLALQHFAENSPQGRTLAAPIFADRPQQVTNVVRALADRIAPEDQNASASAIANRTGAQGALTSARQGFNAQAAPHYDALQTYTLPDDQFKVLSEHPAYAEAQASLRSNPILNATVAHLPDNNLATVNEVTKLLDRNVTANSQTAMNPSGNNQVAAQYQGARSLADQVAGDASPDWSAARDIIAQGHADVLDPMANGPVGRIASKTTIPGQVSAFLPKSAVEGTANDVASAAQALPPEVTGNLTRHYIIDQLNASNPVYPPNQWGGAKLSQALVGNPERASALANALDALDPSGDLTSHSNAVNDALQATGNRWAVGSKTSFNDQMAETMKQGPIRFFTKLADPLEWGQHLDKAMGGRLYQNNVETIVKMLGASPSEAAGILARATPKANGLADQLLLNANGSRQ
jgi:hypothetical protein